VHLNEMVAQMLGLGERKKEWRIADPAWLETELEKRFGRVTRSQGHNGLELICDCYVCGEHKLSVNAVNGIYKCWRGCCSGTVQKLLKKKVPMTTAPAKKVERHVGFLSPGTLTPLASVGDDNPGAVYLRARGFDYRELGRDFGFTYCSPGRPFAHGVFSTTGTVVATVTMDGRDIGWQARLLYDPDKLDNDRCAMLGYAWNAEKQKYVRPPKYFTMPGMDKREVLWNYDNARRSDTVVVTEGVYDAARVGRCAVATLGKYVSDKQVLLLQQYWRHIVILLDPDAAKEAERLRSMFGPTVDVVPVTLRGYKDAGEAPRAEIWSQVFDACVAAGLDPSTFRIEV
jgi:hypothetical protein